ncbi:MAG: hypothetical protein R3B48_21030 [Kofleriaceae bacterium]
MNRRHGDEIAAALVRLGCRIYSEDEVHYFIARANVRTKAIRKWFIPRAQEQAIVEGLDFDMTEYLEALRANDAEENSSLQPTELTSSTLDDEPQE